jgi:hypothetical protein
LTPTVCPRPGQRRVIGGAGGREPGQTAPGDITPHGHPSTTDRVGTERPHAGARRYSAGSAFGPLSGSRTGQIEPKADPARSASKTALHRILQKRYPSLLADVEVLPGFNPAGAPVFQRLTEGEPMSEGQYITIWKAYFLSLVGNWILQLNEGGFSHKMTELDELLKKTGLSSADDSANTIFSQIVNLFRRGSPTRNRLRSRQRSRPTDSQ